MKSSQGQLHFSMTGGTPCMNAETVLLCPQQKNSTQGICMVEIFHFANKGSQSQRQCNSFKSFDVPGSYLSVQTVAEELTLQS